MEEGGRASDREGHAGTRTEREGATVEAPSLKGTLVPGAELGGRYRIVCRVGAGGMGEVWRAFDLKLRVEVALKALREDLFVDERRRDLLRREVRAAREVVSPNVCRIFDLVEADGRELVSMEYVDGATLLSVLQERGPLELKEAQDIASQFLAGLEAIHKAGLVHRDVKPENIMLTRAGRVVLMDFGLARHEEDPARSASGTPAYMAPEQARGEAVDARADVYAAGVVLAEMVCPEGIKSIQSRQSVWEGVRSEPPKLPDTPWAPVLRKAVAREAGQRYHSAHTLTRALEDVTLRVVGAEDLHPYPGLASFTEADAEYFFGREPEVEEMWRKLEGPARLLGLAGPSGAGKSSFLRAGVIPAAGAGWAVVRCTPGDAAVSALRRALIPELAGDTEALQQLVEAGDDGAITAVVTRWRRRHEHGLLIVDQFEELFTQNNHEEQARFGRILGKLALEADAHVLLSLRDDFLAPCNGHEALRPIFHELTLLDPPAGANLRRALTQPALQCGYRFEDDALVDQMLGEVEGERGALPLLAFAAARLWEKRDRDAGLLTRQAYQDIGGVGGALARHAEATMERIGPERVGIVRELFRNLVTAEGTRAVREWNEVLSVFAEPQRPSAEEVLRALIDARLLTSYEVKEEEHGPTRRVEIIHESLLANWPRLVRWQTQDADAAQLRDQLRQAARTWHEHARSDDLLWTGSAYREFAVWRERYPGGLTELEEAFAAAMDVAANRRRRRRRIAVAAGFAILFAVLAVVGTLWRRSVLETRRAEAESSQREAAQLLALGQLRLADHPNAALAYAIASLERADNDPARRFAVEALWQGPSSFWIDDPTLPIILRWSADERWLAIGGVQGLAVLERSGSERRQLISTRESPIGFTPDGRQLVSQDNTVTPRTILHVWAVPEGRLERTLELPERTGAWLVGDRLVTFIPDAGTPGREESYTVRLLSLDGTTRKELGTWRPHGLVDCDVDASGTWIVWSEGRRVLQQRLEALSAPPRVLGEHRGEEVLVWQAPRRGWAVSGDSTGEIRIWDLASARLERTLQSPADARSIALDPGGRFLAACPKFETEPMSLFDLTAPRTAEPIPLFGFPDVPEMTFSPDGSWLGVCGYGSGVLWSTVGPRSLVVGRHESFVVSTGFTPGGDLFASWAEGGLKLLPLSPEAGEGARQLWSRPDANFLIHAVDPAGGFVVGSVALQGETIFVPLDGSPPRTRILTRPEGIPVNRFSASFDPGGRILALSEFAFVHSELNAIRILDLQSGEERTLDTHPQAADRCAEPGSDGAGFVVVAWLSDGRLVSDGDGGLREWDLETGTSRQLRPCREIGLTGFYLLATPDSQTILRLDMADQRTGSSSRLSVFDLDTGEEREISSHGNRLSSFALDRSGMILVTGDSSGVIHVGPLTGEEPHLLFGHTGGVGVAVSPDGRWIASGGGDGTLRLWPMPDLSKPPLHTLPHDELLAKLKSLTNLRAVPDPGSNTGWKIEAGPFPGWATVPEWQP